MTPLLSLVLLPTVLAAVDTTVYTNLTQGLVNILQVIASFGGALTTFGETDRNMVWFFAIAVGITVFTIIYWTLIQHGSVLGDEKHRRRPALIISILAGAGVTLLIPITTYEQVLFFIKNGIVQLALGLAIPAGAYAAYRGLTSTEGGSRNRLEDWHLIGFARILLGVAIAGGNAFLNQFITTFNNVGGEETTNYLLTNAIPWISILSAILSIITIVLFITGIYRIWTDIMPEEGQQWMQEQLGRSGIESARTPEQRMEIITRHAENFEDGATVIRAHINHTQEALRRASHGGPAGNISLQNIFGITRARTENPEAHIQNSATIALRALHDIEELSRVLLDEGRGPALFSRTRRRELYNSIRGLREGLQLQQGTWWRDPAGVAIRAWARDKRANLDVMNNFINSITDTYRDIIQGANRRLTEEQRTQARTAHAARTATTTGTGPTPGTPPPTGTLTPQQAAQAARQALARRRAAAGAGRRGTP